MSGPALPQRMVSEAKPVRALAYVAAASIVLASGLPPLTPDAFDWIGPAVGLVGLVATALLGVRTEAKTVPWEDVAAKQTPSGQLVAGPAAEQRNGTAVTVAPDTFTEPMEGGPL